MRRLAIVKEIDPAKALVRVTFLAHDQMRSAWLGVCSRNTQGNKDYWMPDLGEQVVCLLDEKCEDGEIIGSRYSSVDTPPDNSADRRQFRFSDGAVFKYDRAAHVLEIDLPAGATLNLSVGGNQKLQIDGAGNLQLEGGGPAIARLGDQVTVNDPDDGPIHGTITSASSKAFCG